MQVMQGRSEHGKASDAIDEASRGWSRGGGVPDVIFAFCSTRQDAPGVAAELRRRFPSSLTVGCTTAGEHLGGVRLRGALTLTALTLPGSAWAVEIIESLERFDGEAATLLTDRLIASVGAERESLDPRSHFALLFVDGMGMREEGVIAQLAGAFAGIPVVGGSAGDDLQFRQTTVFANGVAPRAGAAVVLCRTRTPFRVVKHQHFSRTGRLLAVTRADSARRRVLEFDGYPAAQAYARALGIPRSRLTDEVTSMNPLLFSSCGELYVRSIQRVHDDDSLSFYCAIEEGMVLDVASHRDMVEALRRELVRPSGGPTPGLMIAFNCILRALEADARGCAAEVEGVLSEAAAFSTGFDTYGEQLNGLHINQTLLAVLLGP